MVRCIQKIEKKWLLYSSCLYVWLPICTSTWNNSIPTGLIIMKFDVWIFLKKICWGNSSFIKVWQEWRVLYTGEPLYMYDDILEREIFQTKFVEEVKTLIVYSITVFWKWIHLWQNVGKKCCIVGEATYDNLMWCMHFSRCITEATITHSENLILIAIPQQQWLHSTCYLCCMLTVCLVVYCV